MMEKRDVFEFDSIHEAVWSDATATVRRITTGLRDTVLNPDNEHTYHHGMGWTYHTSDLAHRQGAFEKLSLEVGIKFQDVVEHRLDRIPEYIREMCTGMHGEFMKMLYRTVSAAVEETGNVVSTKEAGSPAKAFIQMLRKIEFGVDRHGRVSIPEMHLGKEAHEAMMKDLEAQGAEFRELVESIKREKTQQALEREEERKSKFKGSKVKGNEALESCDRNVKT
jgi:hypothetical protein